MSFIGRFQEALESLCVISENARYVVAYSGGVDSHVLLDCCHKLMLPLRAVHVHHGLQNVADYWVTHCQNICASLDIPFDVVYVDATQKRGQSPEEAARNARYDALQKSLNEGDCLLTAQHQNDQAETLLLQLFRTASSAGLSAMPARRQFGDFLHIRPLLSFSRQEIENYAQENDLYWIEDPSNQDISFDRNYIRTMLMPLLEKRWPEISAQLSKAAGLQANNLQVLEDMAAIDLARVVKMPLDEAKNSAYDVLSMLSIAALKQLSYPRQLNLLRFWIIKNVEARKLKIPPTRQLLEEIIKTMVNAQHHKAPVIMFSVFEFRKYQHDLYLLKPLLSKSAIDDISSYKAIWQERTPLPLAGLNIQLKAVEKTGEGLVMELFEEPLLVRFREGGENFHPAGRRHSQSLKKLLQEAGIPPWQRDIIPLLYLGDELIAVAGLWISKKYAVQKDKLGWLVQIESLLPANE